MAWMMFSGVSSMLNAVTSGSGVITSLATMSPKSNTFSIHCCSSWAMAPCSPLFSTIRRMSSSLAASSSASVFRPSSFRLPLVVTLSSAIMGANTVLTTFITPSAILAQA